MSLDWNVSKVKNADAVCWQVCEKDNPAAGEKAGETYMKPLTNALIWATMAVDLGEISEKNAAEFTRRLDVLFDSGSPIMQGYTEGEGWKPRRITLDEVTAHIGLRTNVSNMTPKQWASKQAKIAKQNAERAARYAK